MLIMGFLRRALKNSTSLKFVFVCTEIRNSPILFILFVIFLRLEQIHKLYQHTLRAEPRPTYLEINIATNSIYFQAMKK